MSKYKAGDKVVLTVTSTNEMGCLPCYVLNDDLILSKQDIDKYTEPLTAYTEPLEAKIRRQAEEITRLLAENEKLKEECNQVFNQGTEAAWELARKIVIPNGYSSCDLYEIFGKSDLQHVLENYTYTEATAKVAEWRMAKEEVKRGDVVKAKCNTSSEFCVTDIGCDGHLYGVGRYGMTYSNKNPEDWEKTGRHIDIDSFLKQIGEE